MAASSSSKKSSSLLAPGTVLKERWELIEKIGGGGFGEIYRTKDFTNGQICALKAESSINGKQVLRMEALVLKRLQGIEQVCEFIGCGKTANVNFLVMTLLGPNLSELRKKRPNQKFTIPTVLRLGIQIIKVIQAMHNSGFLHRDIKPSNFAMGLNEATSKTCYILDFGLSRQYIMPTGELKQPRVTAGFRGTVRYASMNAHMGRELGRHDDLWSVFYLLVELAIGQLPWKYIRDKEDVKNAKLCCDHESLIGELPLEFSLYLEHLKQLTYYDKPNYMYLIQQLEQALERIMRTHHEGQCKLYDWDEQPIPPRPPLPISPLISSAVILSLDDTTTQSVGVPVVPVGKDDVITSYNDDDLNKKEISSEITQSKHTIAIKSSQVDTSSLLHNHQQILLSSAISSHETVTTATTATTHYVIPLPSRPKPPGYFCATARRKRFVKCNDPYVLIK